LPHQSESLFSHLTKPLWNIENIRINENDGSSSEVIFFEKFSEHIEHLILVLAKFFISLANRYDMCPQIVKSLQKRFFFLYVVFTDSETVGIVGGPHKMSYFFEAGVDMQSHHDLFLCID